MESNRYNELKLRLGQSIILALIILVVTAANLYSQTIASFKVELDGESDNTAIPVEYIVENLSDYSANSLQLYEVGSKNRTPVELQISKENPNAIIWLVKPRNQSDKKINYELVAESSNKKARIISTDSSDGLLKIKLEDKILLGYQFETMYPPVGIDTAYKRSGFIHPLNTPHGQVLTQIQPEDHYHHYGIWNPWTHVLFESDTVDFWNLKDMQGTVRFKKFISFEEGPVFAEYNALLEHVVFKKDDSEKVALNEIQSVRVYKTDDPDYYIADITIELTCASESPVKLLEYRYGGFGWRATEEWNKDNSEVLTSAGKTRKDADGSLAKWCIVQGDLDNDFGGIVMMSHPDNYNHPEPLRIWPGNMSGNGDVFFNFSPTKNKDWLLLPGKTYLLQYRLIVFNGHYTKEKADIDWSNFANQIKIKSN